MRQIHDEIRYNFIFCETVLSGTPIFWAKSPNGVPRPREFESKRGPTLEYVRKF